MTDGDYQFIWRDFDDLSSRALYAILKLRQDVFVVEQQCLYNDIDGGDPAAKHLLAIDGRTGSLGGYLRLTQDDTGDRRIGRVVVRKDQRGNGLSQKMLDEALSHIERYNPTARIVLSAQSYLLAMYEAAGFTAISAEYLEDGIPHIDMALTKNLA
jgi:ElaA protein